MSCGSRRGRRYKMNRGDFVGLLGFLWPGQSQVCHSNAMDRKSFHSRCKAGLFKSPAFWFTSIPFLSRTYHFRRKSTLLLRKSPPCQSISPLCASVLFLCQAPDFGSVASGFTASPTRFFSLLLLVGAPLRCSIPPPLFAIPIVSYASKGISYASKGNSFAIPIQSISAYCPSAASPVHAEQIRCTSHQSFSPPLPFNALCLISNPYHLFRHCSLLFLSVAVVRTSLLSKLFIQFIKEPMRRFPILLSAGHQLFPHPATILSSCCIVSIRSPHHSGRFALTIASASGGHTAFPHLATCFVFPYTLPL